MTELVKKSCLACGAENETFGWAGDNWDCRACGVRQLFYRRGQAPSRPTGCAHHGRDVGVPCDVCGKVKT